jgi:hypothetical protein
MFQQNSLKHTVLFLILLFGILTHAFACTCDSLIPFSYNGNIGYLNNDFEIQIAPKYFKGTNFTSMGFAIVQIDESFWAILSENGNEIVTVKTSLMWHLTKDLFAYYSQSGVTIINTSGEIVLQDLSAVRNASDGIIPVRFKGKGWAYVDENCDLIFGERYFKEASPFSEEYAVITEENWLSGCIDLKGNVVIEIKYKQLGLQFLEGLCYAKYGESTGYINKQGDFVFKMPISEYTDFENGVALIKNLDGAWRVIRKSGEYVSPPLGIEYTWGFKEGLALASVETEHGFRYGFINNRGEFVIEPKFQEAEQFNYGWSRVVLNEQEGLLNRDGRFILSKDIMEGNIY